LTNYHRHPNPQSHPSFQQLKDALFLPDSSSLEWGEKKEEEGNCYLEAMMLGGSLQVAEGLYLDLQNTYKPAM